MEVGFETNCEFDLEDQYYNDLFLSFMESC